MKHAGLFEALRKEVVELSLAGVQVLYYLVEEKDNLGAIKLAHGSIAEKNICAREARKNKDKMVEERTGEMDIEWGVELDEEVESDACAEKNCDIGTWLDDSIQTFAEGTTFAEAAEIEGVEEHTDAETESEDHSE